MGGTVDRHGSPITAATNRPAAGADSLRCGLLYRRGQGEADRLCVPDRGGFEPAYCRSAATCPPIGGHFGRLKTAALVRRLASWPRQTRGVVA